MYTFLLYMANFIRTRKVVNNKANNVPKLKNFDKATWNFIFSIYNSVWDLLSSDKYNNLFRLKLSSKFTPKPLKINLGPTLGILKSKATEIINTMTKAKTNIWQSYAQVANSEVFNILKLKKNYPNLLAKKIKNIHMIINNTDKTKPHIKMTTKGPLQTSTEPLETSSQMLWKITFN